MSKTNCWCNGTGVRRDLPGSPRCNLCERGPVRDNFGVTIEIGDFVRVLSWGAPVRLIDCGRAAEVIGFTRTGNVVLDGARFGHAVDRIAGGRAVRPGHLGVLDRSDRDNPATAGYEGNRPRPVAEDRDFYDNLHDSIPSDVPATAWDSDSASKGA